MKKITVYTKGYCPYCNSAKELLKTRNIDFEEIKLDESNDNDWLALVTRSGMKTVPQIFCEGELIGGYRELAALDSKDQLESLRAK